MSLEPCSDVALNVKGMKRPTTTLLMKCLFSKDAENVLDRRVEPRTKLVSIELSHYRSWKWRNGISRESRKLCGVCPKSYVGQTFTFTLLEGRVKRKPTIGARSKNEVSLRRIAESRGRLSYRELCDSPVVATASKVCVSLGGCEAVESVQV